MAVKTVELPDIGTVKLYKRRGVRSIRLSVTARGEVRVSLPPWLPYSAASTFALAKRAWIQSQLRTKQAPLQHGQAIGKSHHLQFVSSASVSKVTARVDGTVVRIIRPKHLTFDDEIVQKSAERASIRVLRIQAETLLPQRLATLAAERGLSFRSVSIKRLSGRWGSCDAHTNIVLNLFLMQLPWHLIDYVLLHELTHTRVLHHGAAFWAEFEQHLPGAKELRREVHAYRPAVMAAP